MIAEQARAHQEQEQTRELVKIIQKVAKKGPLVNGGIIKGNVFQERGLKVSSIIYTQISSEWHFIEVKVGDDSVFRAGALKAVGKREPLDFTIDEYRTGEWETRVRRMARSKPKGKR